MKRIRYTANLSKNAEAKRHLANVVYQAEQGKLDFIFGLTTFKDDLENGQIVKRTKTMLEIDEDIATSRESMISSLNFAIDQLSLFSTYLRQKVGDSTKIDGYDHNVIFQNITTEQFMKLVMAVFYKLDIEVTEELFRKFKPTHEILQKQALVLKEE